MLTNRLLPRRGQNEVNAQLVNDEHDYGESLERWPGAAGVTVDARPEQTFADQRHDGRLRHVHLAQGGRRGRGERHVHVQLVDLHRRRGGQLLVERLSVPVVGAAGAHPVQLRDNDCGGPPEQHHVHGLQRRAEPVQAKPVRCGPRHGVGEHA